MKVTGYKLQHTLREPVRRRDTEAARFGRLPDRIQILSKTLFGI